MLDQIIERNLASPTINNNQSGTSSNSSEERKPHHFIEDVSDVESPELRIKTQAVKQDSLLVKNNSTEIQINRNSDENKYDLKRLKTIENIHT